MVVNFSSSVILPIGVVTGCLTFPLKYLIHLQLKRLISVMLFLKPVGVGAQGNEKSIYDFVVRHFLACCSRDAQGQETTVEIDINDERVSRQSCLVSAYVLWSVF